MHHLLNAPSRVAAFGIMRLPSSASASSSSQHHRILCGSAELSTSSSNLPWLVVGLGNPGKLYQGTRHNVGFEMIEAFAEAEGIRMTTTQHKALMGRGEVGSSQVLVAKPQTFVNLSGESVGPLATYYRIPIHQILVIYDDMDLEFARLRLLPKGGHGGHNGMRSVIQHLKGSKDFPRLKIGIGRPPGKMEPASFVLRKFAKDEREEMDIMLARGIDVVREVILKGAVKACSTCNEPKKGQVKTSGKASVQTS
ncbi:hypothetical protein GOP47_0029415 [Adiantum capillus-veneris]|nr:hypothetical protein GOP47_0029415 [Adiantum capillus-veneris]